MPELTAVLRPLDPGQSQPLYQQLQRAIREAIENRLLAPDDALPPERQLSPPQLQLTSCAARTSLHWPWAEWKAGAITTVA